jgi:hypothetical protein
MTGSYRPKGYSGDTVVMMGDATENWPAAPAHVHVYVDDVDAVYRRALEAGGIPRAAARAERRGSRPTRRGEGSRREYLVDCDPGTIGCP